MHKYRLLNPTATPGPAPESWFNFRELGVYKSYAETKEAAKKFSRRVYPNTMVCVTDTNHIIGIWAEYARFMFQVIPCPFNFHSPPTNVVELMEVDGERFLAIKDPVREEVLISRTEHPKERHPIYPELRPDSFGRAEDMFKSKSTGDGPQFGPFPTLTEEFYWKV